MERDEGFVSRVRPSKLRALSKAAAACLELLDKEMILQPDMLNADVRERLVKLFLKEGFSRDEAEFAVSRLARRRNLIAGNKDTKKRRGNAPVLKPAVTRPAGAWASRTDIVPVELSLKAAEERNARAVKNVAAAILSSVAAGQLEADGSIVGAGTAAVVRMLRMEYLMAAIGEALPELRPEQQRGLARICALFLDKRLTVRQPGELRTEIEQQLGPMEADEALLALDFVTRLGGAFVDRPPE